MNKRTSDYIADQLADEILSGRMKAGAFLRQEEISEAIGASRIPVREALQVMVEQGLAVRLVTRHIAVAEMTDEHICQIYGMIGELEYKILVEYCKDNGSGTHLTRMEPNVEHMTIHRKAYGVAKNVYFGHLLKNAVECYVRFAVTLITKQEQEKMNGLMRAMANAVEKGDQQAVICHIEEYYQQLAQLVIEERGKNA